ncbi:hypothetical protein LSUE1_G008055 [Lachnellula suecica]|uniref:Uncharacterized protein n=1 Tax=Lachnellula suecica TaxID=602035 RepID=A0A8T9C4W6_9HELO|nr:hypothetical protein LSUE1_G008055 [Lachnellula suecica]
MQRRNSLSRRKSTSSVQGKHESIDPTVSRQHAHVAANLAFARAQDRNSGDMGHNGARGHERQSFSQQNAPNNGEHVIKRQQSVRFVGPNAVQRKQSIGTRTHAIHRKESTGTLRPMAMTTNAPVPAAYRPPSRSSSIGKGSMSKTTGDSFATALAAYDQYYTREDDIASTPSSYRRIRRSKSMFSPLQAPPVFYTNGTPDRTEASYMGRSGFQDTRTPQSQPSQATLRAPKSMSFLRSGFREHNDEAVQMARDRFFHQTNQQRLSAKPSFLFRSKTQKSDKPFRQSVRSSSANSYGMPVASANQPNQPKEFVLKNKARKVSKTIKNKLKRVFGLSKDDPVAIPNQQIDAQETHVRRYNGDASSQHEEFKDIPHPDEAALSRVASRVPSIRIQGSNEKLKSHTGSVRSFRSEHSDDKSRVTSWTSTVANTVTSQGPAPGGLRPLTEREQQRLSIINENGTHVSSSSFNRPRISNQFSAYPVMHRQSKSAGNVPSVDSARVYSALMKRLDDNSPKAKLAASRLASVDSFGAPTQIPTRGSSIHSSKGSRTPATIRTVTSEDANSTGRSHRSPKHDHPLTISNSVYAARSEDDFGHAAERVHQWATADPKNETQSRNDDDVFSPKPSVVQKENIPIADQRSWNDSNASVNGLTRKPSTKSSYYSVPEEKYLTPQEIALRNEPIISAPKGLRESRSTFFGGSKMTIARTTSPFRRAMAESDSLSTVMTSSQVSLVPNPLYLAPEKAHDYATRANHDDESLKAYTESVYSRTTSGHNPAAISAVSLMTDDQSVPEMPFLNTGNGDAVILDRVTYRPAMPHGNGHRETVSGGSVEWKKWMSSEVAKLERVKENSNVKETSHGTFVNYALPTMPKSYHGGHVRENAQINDDDTEIVQRKVSGVKQPLGLVQQYANSQMVLVIDDDIENAQRKVSGAKQPLGLVQQNPNVQTAPNPPALRPILKNRSAVSLIENIEPANANKAPIPPPPPMPNYSPIRSVKSKSSLRSVGTTITARNGSAPNSALKVSSMSGRNVLHKRNESTTTLRSTKSVETPAKLVKKHGRPLNTTVNTPGSTSAASDKFGSASTRYQTPGVGAGIENFRMRDPEDDDPYGVEGAGLMGPDMGGELSERDAQAMGSKRMVELFLTSRRRRINGSRGASDESGAFI